jgi:hypothetical protein
MTKAERERHWRSLLERQATSGMSVRTWCALEEVGYATFRYWRRRLGRSGIVAPLTLIRVTEGESVGDGLWLSVGGVRIEVKPGFDAGLLKQVVAALAA